MIIHETKNKIQTLKMHNFLYIYIYLFYLLSLEVDYRLLPLYIDTVR